MRKLILTSLIAALPLSVLANTEIPAKQAEARQIAKEFGGMLKPELGKAMKSGGPVHAVGMCKDKAPEIAKILSEKSGWNVNRVSLKPRGKTAYADSWETATLTWFDEQAAAGKDIKTLEKFEIVKIDGQDTIRYMKPLGTAAVCLTCHGESIPQGVTDKVKELYPHDMATGYKLGQIRGAFSFQQALN